LNLLAVGAIGACQCELNSRAMRRVTSRTQMTSYPLEAVRGALPRFGQDQALRFQSYWLESSFTYRI
jgi:hypothetical protein